MNWDFMVACYQEAHFCAKHYDKDAYWRDHTIRPEWYECYQMGNEL